MPHTPMSDLKDFHDRFTQDGADRLSNPITISLLNKRRKLIQEESREVIEALDYLTGTLARTMSTDIENSAPTGWSNLAKELADLLYVVYGTAEELGIPLEEVFTAVHESNMDKLWPDGQVHYNEYGKVIKPPTYQPPDLSGILNATAE